MGAVGKSRYLIAIGSNRRHHRHGAPACVVGAAIHALEKAGLKIKAVAPLCRTKAIGPAGRDFANGAILAATRLEPDELLTLLKQTERAFGRRKGRRWGARVLDLDIILWSGGVWAEDALVVPHPAFRDRGFVLDPLQAIAPGWRDPLTNLTVAQLRYRNRKRPPAA